MREDRQLLPACVPIISCFYDGVSCIVKEMQKNCLMCGDCYFFSYLCIIMLKKVSKTI